MEKNCPVAGVGNATAEDTTKLVPVLDTVVTKVVSALLAYSCVRYEIVIEVLYMVTVADTLLVVICFLSTLRLTTISAMTLSGSALLCTANTARVCLT